MIDGPVILMGHDRFGHVRKCWEAFQLYGFRDGVALVNSKQSFLAGGAQPQGLRLVEVDDLFDPVVVAESIRGISAGPSTGPFICTQDNLGLSYLAALEYLGYESSNDWIGTRDVPWVPVGAVRRCRAKPFARRRWNLEMVDPTRWALLRWTGKHYEWLPLGGLYEEDDGNYFVKPVAGEGSQMVGAAKGAGAAFARASEIRAFYETVGQYARNRSVSCDGFVIDPGSDVLVEEMLEGPEFTIDGFVTDGTVSCVIQHKETMWRGEFIGDGLVLCPPDWDAGRRIGQVASPSLEPSLPVHAADREFRVLVSRGLAALGLNYWAFHAEVIETRDGLRFVELNPRPAGGLVGSAAACHLGMDLFEGLVRMHLRIPTPVMSRDQVTGEFPIYATQTGVVAAVEGLEAVRCLPGVVRVEEVIRPGERILYRHEENVIVAVLIQGSDHIQLRDLEWQVRRRVQVSYSSSGD